MWTRGIIWNKNYLIRSFRSRATRDRLGLGVAMADRPADDGQGDPGDERERTGKSLALPYPNRIGARDDDPSLLSHEGASCRPVPLLGSIPDAWIRMRERPPILSSPKNASSSPPKSPSVSPRTRRSLPSGTPPPPGSSEASPRRSPRFSGMRFLFLSWRSSCPWSGSRF
jgi:hypothetical protein